MRQFWYEVTAELGRQQGRFTSPRLIKSTDMAGARLTDLRVRGRPPGSDGFEGEFLKPRLKRH